LAKLAQGINPNEESRNKKTVELARSFTLKEAIENYIEIASWKDKTKQDAISTFNRWFSDWFSLPLASIDKQKVQRHFGYIKDRVAHNKYIRDKKRLELGLPIKTYDNEIGLGEAQRAFRYLSAVFNSYIEDDAGDEKLLPKGNPCNVIKTKKLRKTLKPRERYLDSRERSILYDTLASVENENYLGNIQPDDADLIMLLIHTGLRLDEARTMEWSAVDLTREKFTAYNTKNGTNHTLPMTAATKRIFQSRYDKRTSEKYVFPSPINEDRQLKPMSASRTFQRVSDEVGFTFTAHDLRRTVATVAFENGYDLDAIGQVLNHTRQSVTARYVQQTESRMRGILETIQDALFPRPTD
jgi:integrase